MITDIESLVVDLGIEFTDNPEITDTVIEMAQSKLGCKLPSSYLEVLRISNGGVFNRNAISINSSITFESIDDRNGYYDERDYFIKKDKTNDRILISYKPSIIFLPPFYGIGGLEGIDYSNENGKTTNQILIENWRYPKSSVVINHGGDAGFYLDYAKCGHDGEPQVFYRCSAIYPYIQRILVSPTFEDFINRLVTEAEALSSPLPIESGELNITIFTDI